MYMHLAKEFSEELNETASREDIAEALGRVSASLGFDHFALSLDLNTLAGEPQDFLVHDYPEQWAKVYVNLELGGRDPVRRACDRSVTGFDWGSMERIVPLTRGDRQMLSVGQECGIADGYTVPRHLPGRVKGSCTFAVSEANALPSDKLYQAEIVGALALARALSFSRVAPVAATARLSDRQRECLLWVARGKTAAETALILGISSETVTQHLKISRERYAVHSCQTLVLSALSDGLIGFSDVIPPYGERRSMQE